ncbi:zinc-ribbon domain-containing protein [Rhodococcus sp. IEGM 1401]|nr:MULTISPECIES: zinc-ribbon domain-containing protein [unclassified Rhodococcus (in: high G+C Gram-positive bacteria)]MCZ4563961.1 zinc-ribbon domain-containing protein [Rhodococcus sp. IEGM 1401]MDI9924121.1 zinc-ribbon domain-containing protein [Rhodococcus sp. IEGM 1372]MDV8079806.1 zinc-ribbon domain-containing protein [Rhodococcus sp. IEGM 1370]
MADFGWHCECSRNSRSSNPASPRPGRKLLADSDSPAVDWWDHEHNDDATFRTVTVLATRICRWRCPTCGLRFEAKPAAMTERPICPDCETRQREVRSLKFAEWKTTPVADVPELAAAWADDADPREVMVAGGSQLRRFHCPRGHHPRLTPTTFLQTGCPSCRGAAKEKRWLADTSPEIAGQWHPTLNGRFTPQNVVWDSKRTVWWRADCCGCEWQDSVVTRDKYQRLRCPDCRTFLGSLAWHDPGLAAEWSPTNPLSAWNVRPHTTTSFVPEWICAINPDHTWQAPLSSRSIGAECPDCRQAGKSRVELAHHTAAKEAFGNARSGKTIRSKAFTTRKAWTADISVDVDGYTVVIEYDGAYWHRAPAKILVDERKSRDLLAAGFWVVRLREDDLPALGIDHPCYREIRVYSAAARPRQVLSDVRQWMTDSVA